MEAIYFFISVIGFGIASYTDLKERIVPNKLTYSMIALGLGLHLIQSITGANWVSFGSSLATTIYAFGFGFILYKLGVWAGGDVKLFTGIAALNPVNYGIIRNLLGLSGINWFASVNLWIFPLSLFVFSVLAMLPYALLISLHGIIHDKEMRKELIEGVKKRIIQLIELSLVIVLFEIAANMLNQTAIDWKIIFIHTIQVFASLFLLYFVIEVYLASLKVLKEEKKITELKEGMISDEEIAESNREIKRITKMKFKEIIGLLVEGKINELMQKLNPKHKTIISSHDAGGLTKEQIDLLQKLVKEGKLENKLRLKKSAAFTPAMAIAYLILQSLGDIGLNLAV